MAEQEQGQPLQPQQPGPYKKEGKFIVVDVPFNFATQEKVERLEHIPIGTDSHGCNHYFERTTANEIICTRCQMGLFINPTDVVVDGKLNP